MRRKSILRQVLLAPLWPRLFLASAGVLRFMGVLPKRIPSRWPPRRVLVVNLTSNLGDTLMMLPLMDALQGGVTGVEIDVVVQSPMDAPLRAIPYVRRVYSFGRVSRNIPIFSHYLRVFRMVQFGRRELRGVSYDLALLPRWGRDPDLSSYLAAMSTASRRCGHDPEEDQAAESVLPGMAGLLTDVSHGGAGMAEAIRERLLLQSCGLAPEFNAMVEEHRPVESVLQMARSVDICSCMERLAMEIDRPFILLAPGASHAVRCWPPERFAALGVELHGKTGVAVYSVGGPGDRRLCEDIEELSGGQVRSLAGRTSVLEAIALTRRARLLVSNDSGPAHVGGSVGTSTIVLSACPRTSTEEHANSPLRVRPVGPKVHVLQPERPQPGCRGRCTARDAHCILGIETASVLRIAELSLCYTDGSGGTLRIDRTTTAGAPTATL